MPELVSGVRNGFGRVGRAPPEKRYGVFDLRLPGAIVPATENPRVAGSILALTRSIPVKWVTVKSRNRSDSLGGIRWYKNSVLVR